MQLSVQLPRHVDDYAALMDMFTSIRPNDFLKRDGLDYFREILKLLDNPEKHLGKVIHITGTNGKGSVSWKTARTIEDNLGGNTKVGLYVSPNIYDFEERISINGTPISHVDMVKFTNIILNALDGKTSEDQPRYVDFRIGMVGILVCMAFLYFRDQQVSYSVIEGGIGAKMDHTNVVTSVTAAVITSISLDHTPMLGNTVEEIAFDKAHIIKEGTPVIIGPRVGEAGKALRVIEDKASDEGLSKDQVIKVPPPRNQNFEFDNQATARAVLSITLGQQFKADQLTLSPPGRYHLIEYPMSDNNTLPCIFDVGHNADAFTAIFSRCIQDFPDYKFVLVCGINATKEAAGMYRAINELERLTNVLVYAVEGGKFISYDIVAQSLKQTLQVQDYQEIGSMDEYLQSVATPNNHTCVLVTGSFYVVGGVSNAMEINLLEQENRQVVPQHASTALQGSSQAFFQQEGSGSAQPIDQLHGVMSRYKI